MSEITHGNNPEQMGQLASMLNQKAEEIKGSVAQLTNQLGGTAWNGPDAQKFRSEWEGHRAQLTQIAEALNQVSTIVTQNQNAQIETSNS